MQIPRVVRGVGIALGVFLAAFALHIVGGATDQRWLFITAVVLIFISAVAFPVVALVASGRTRAPRRDHVVAGLIGIGLTWSALWAASDRTMEAWQPFASVALVAAVSIPMLGFFAKWFKAAETQRAARASARKPRRA